MMIFIPVTFGMGYNVQKTEQSVKREATAVNMAINKIESAKISAGSVEAAETSQTVDGVSYKITVSYPSDETAENGTKVINVKVEYPVGKTTQTVDISTRIKST